MSSPPLGPVRVEMAKWGDRPHWRFTGLLLGHDRHGSWVGVRAGTRHQRPGLTVHSEVDSVTLVPPGQWWLATFHADGIWCRTYVDIATPAEWDGSVLRSIDLDLDVIRLAPDHSPPTGYTGPPVTPGAVFVDDEDEFAAHQRTLGYPPEVVRSAERSCAQVRRAVQERRPPFDATVPAGWLRRLSAATG